MRTAFAMAALGAASALGGCSPGDPVGDEFAQYGQRTTTISPGAGNTQAANTAIQSIDPWPRYAFDRRIPGNGALSVKAVHDFESPGAASGGGAPTATATPSAGGGGTPGG